MNSQTNITLLVLLILIEMTAINAEFTDDRENLGECYKTLMEKLKSWSRYRYTPAIDPITTYETLLQGFMTTGLKGFETQTKVIFEQIVFESIENTPNGATNIPSIDFSKNSATKAEAIVQVCKDVEENCPTDYHAPNVPLVDYLETLYDKTGIDNSDFVKNCKTAAEDRS